MQDHLPAFSDLVRVRLEGTALVVEREGAPSLGQRCAVESTLAEILGAMRQLAGAEVAPRAVTFQHRAPRSSAAHAAHFGVAPRFRSERHAMELSAATLNLRVGWADRALHRYLVGELQKLAPRRGTTWTERVRAEAMRRLPRALEVTSLAPLLGTRARTLQRRLAEAGTSFEAVVDGARHELACALLADRERAVTEVAAACGFADGSSFARAFRRWTGASPATWRAKR